MPIEIGIWRIGEKVEKIEFQAMDYEGRLEDILTEDISILDSNLFLIGRQVPTAFGKFIDLLAMDADGNLVVIELKRDKTPREIVAQVLDYGSWVRELEDEDIAGIYEKFLQKYKLSEPGKSFDEAFCERFDVTELPEALNDSHELVIIAGELDDSTERIVNYLSDEYGVAINGVFFRCFKDGENEYLSRVWLIDPGEVETKTVEKRGGLQWNKEYYGSFGEQDSRRWVDGRKHGYIAAGGGDWYSRSLKMLEEGARIWVNVPGKGYVGVGKVKEKATPISQFKIENEQGELVPVTEVLEGLPAADKPLDQQEYFVRVDWIKTVPLENAVRETGFFGNQNSAARPKSKKWIHTIDRLKKRWNIKN